MKDYYSKDFHSKPENKEEIAMQLDNLKIMQKILSRQMQPKQYNGIINLSYIILNRNATSEEIASTLVMGDKLKQSFQKRKIDVQNRFEKS